MKARKALPRDSSILALGPAVDENGLLTVGERLLRSDQPDEDKHPIILTGKHHVATDLIRHHHELVKHQVRLLTEGAVRAAGLWITGCKRLITSILYKCVKCGKLRGQPCEQKMSDLLVHRLSQAPILHMWG
ncbi:uncharacterized protein LOC135465535 [Liolophura sinensis]|uniref:uncharacterized protein LOC135465535 n=1 Tax=Liolophura sinensis TaxID=3198878 RepID=UPI00315909B6